MSKYLQRILNYTKRTKDGSKKRIRWDELKKNVLAKVSSKGKRGFSTLVRQGRMDEAKEGLRLRAKGKETRAMEKP